MLSISIQSAAPVRMNSAAVSRFMLWTKTMSGISFLTWPKSSSTCVSCQSGLGYSAMTRSKSCERNRSMNCSGVITTSELTVNRAFEFMQAALNVCQRTMNKEDSHEISSRLRYAESGSSFNLLEVEFRSPRHGHPLG